ncbi:MAG: hypothetical protein CMM02_01200 [Rhodopirellula sp.]|nr:hypothetical protein [Rhodopirellula sp.]
MSDLIIRVLQKYDIRPPDSVTPFHGGAGFSGSSIWKVAWDSQDYCLKQWPKDKPSVRTRQLISRVIPEMQRQGLPIAVPQETNTGRRFLLFENRFWDLSPWVAGAPVKDRILTETQLQSAMQWLAKYHNLSSSLISEKGRSTALAYRLKLSRQLVEGQLDRLSDCEIIGLDAGLAHLFISYARQKLPRLLQELEHYAHLEMMVLPALSDIWSDHVFFEGGKVSGVIDFGALKMDSACLDLSRFLGSYRGHSDSVKAQGLEYYQRERALDRNGVELVELFDRAYVVLAGVQWLIWLGLEQRVFKQMEIVNRHLHGIAQRIVF